MNFRKTIKQLMKEKNMSIAKLARAADLNYGTVYNFLAGRSQMMSSNLEKILNTLRSL